MYLYNVHKRGTHDTRHASRGPSNVQHALTGRGTVSVQQRTHARAELAHPILKLCFRRALLA